MGKVILMYTGLERKTENLWLHEDYHTTRYRDLMDALPSDSFPEWKITPQQAEEEVRKICRIGTEDIDKYRECCHELRVWMNFLDEGGVIVFSS